MQNCKPVSSVLKELTWQQVRRGLPIHIWLDPEGDYQQFVAELQQSELPYQVIVFRGSYLEVMLDVDTLLSGIDAPRTLIYLPHHDEKRAQASPLLEMILSGECYTLPLTNLVKEAAAGRCSVEKTAEFLDQENFALQDADQWLDLQLREQQGEFWSFLHSLPSFADVADVILRPTEEVNILQLLRTPANMQTFWRYVEAKTGVSKEWLPRTAYEKNPRSEVYDLLYAFASWALCVEFVSDLGKVSLPETLQDMRKLSKTFRDNCCALSEYLRNNEKVFYENIADETESLPLFDEVRNISADKLGAIDSFRFEEDALFQAALNLVKKDDFKQALEWANTRLEKNSFWLRISHVRRSSWELLKGACQLGMTLNKAPKSLGVMNSIEEAADFYAEKCAVVDQHHRHLEQLRYRLLKSSLPQFEELQHILNSLRKNHQQWVNQLAKEFNALNSEYGFLPGDDYQQRFVFSQILKPMSDEGKVAFFMVDALRYEMALELKELLNLNEQDEVKLGVRLAELPTNTNVGMNILAPSTKDNLVELIVKGEQIDCVQGTGSYRIANPKTRRAAIKDGIGGQTSPDVTMTDILYSSARALRKKFSHSKVAVIPYLGIDRAGEEGKGEQKFSDCLKTLRSAWQKMREAGFDHFVFVADHGFLLVDPNFPQRKTHGRSCDNNRRHIVTSVGANHPGEVRVRLRDLNYKVEKDLHLIMPEDASVFDNGFPYKNFVHGGNSLQERVIPVLQIIHSHKQQKLPTEYGIVVKSSIMDRNIHLQLRVVRKSSDDLFDALEQQAIEVELSAVDDPNTQLQIQHTFGNGEYKNETLTIKENSELNIFLQLESTNCDTTRLKIRLPHVAAQEYISEEFFPVVKSAVNNSTSEAVQEISAENWLDNIKDDNAQRIFQYLNEHGAITEKEAAGLLVGKSSARAYRKFRRNLDEYVKKAPFTVYIENDNGMDRLVRKRR